MILNNYFTYVKDVITNRNFTTTFNSINVHIKSSETTRRNNIYTSR